MGVTKLRVYPKHLCARSLRFPNFITCQDFVDTFFLELEGELRVEETVTKVRALTLKNTLLSGDVAVTIGGKVKTEDSTNI